MLDTRDYKVYRIKKMVDGNCWMVDNLALDLNKAHTPAAPTFTPAAQLLTTEAGANNIAQYALNPDYKTNAGDSTYLYNWCAAMGDT